MALITSMPSSCPIGIHLVGILTVIAIVLGIGCLSFIFLAVPARRVVSSALLYSRCMAS
jgi:hypothetical protein